MANGKTVEVACSKCQKSYRVQFDVFKKRVEKYGGEDSMRQKYLCQGCRREVNGKPAIVRKQRVVTKAEPTPAPAATA